MATNIFSIIEGLTVTNDDILEAETFTEQYLSAQFPTYDFRQGTALRDMTVRPNATLLALVQKAITYYFDESDVINMTNDTDSDLVDRRLSNMFITRKTGSSAVVNARLYFLFPLNKPINTLIPSSAYFSIDNKTMFYPEGNILVSAPEAVTDPEKYYFAYDSAAGQWYCDVNLTSKAPDVSANVDSGDLLYFSIFSPYFIRASIQYKVSDAIAPETNKEMVDRSYSAISTRNLINTPSIISRVNDKFNFVKSVYPVGLGDIWMYRDLVTIDSIQHHKGGHVDVYLDTVPMTQTVQLTAVEDEDHPGEAAFYVSGPIFGVRRSETHPANKPNDTVSYLIGPGLGIKPFTYEQSNVSEYNEVSIPLAPEKDLGLSADQITKIKFVDTISIGETATFTFDVFSGIASVNTSLNSRSESVVCADYLARSFEPTFIDIAVETRGATVFDKAKIEELLKEHCQSIVNGGTLYMTELVNILIDGGVKDFKMPLSVTATRYPKDSKGTQAGPTNAVVHSVTDSEKLQTVGKFYLRNITYTAA